MAISLGKVVKKMIYGDLKVSAFVVTRLKENEIKEKVFLLSSDQVIDITTKHGMICLDPFCVAIWLQQEQAGGLEYPRAGAVCGRRVVRVVAGARAALGQTRDSSSAGQRYFWSIGVFEDGRSQSVFEPAI